MAIYKSIYTGHQIDEGITKANDAATVESVNSLTETVSTHTTAINNLTNNLNDTNENVASNLESIISLAESKQDKLTAGENVKIENNVISAEGGAPITIVNELPEANEENFEKGKIYTTGELLQYISKVALSEPNISQVNTLPVNLMETISVAVGSDIYLFGGQSGYSSVYDNYKYNAINNTLEKLNLNLGYISLAAAVGTNIYLFGGTDKIRKFNTQTNEVEIIGTTNNDFSDAAIGTAAAVGSDIYLFGGFSNKVVKFNSLDNSCVTLSSTIPGASSSQGYKHIKQAAAVVGKKVYIFGGYTNSYLNRCIIFNTETNIFTQSNSSMEEQNTWQAVATLGTDIFIFGGGVDTTISKIYKYSPSNDTFTLLSVRLPKSAYKMSAAAVGTNIYLFGGTTKANDEQNSQLNTIYEAEFGFNYTFKTISTQ